MKLKSVQTGVLLAAIVAIVLMLLCLGGYYFYQSSELKKQSEASKKDRALLVKRLLSVSTEKYLQPVKDNSAWDDLYNAVKDIDTATIDECVGYMPETYQSGCVAVFDVDGNKIYDSHIPNFPTNIFPFDGKDLIEFFSDPDRTTFTVNIDGRLFNYIGAGIVPTDDEYTRQTPPIGYILLIREVLELDIKLHCKALGEIDAEMFLAEDEKNDYIKTLDDLTEDGVLTVEMGGTTILAIDVFHLLSNLRLAVGHRVEFLLNALQCHRGVGLSPDNIELTTARAALGVRPVAFAGHRYSSATMEMCRHAELRLQRVIEVAVAE